MAPTPRLQGVGGAKSARAWALVRLHTTPVLHDHRSHEPIPKHHPHRAPCFAKGPRPTPHPLPGKAAAVKVQHRGPALA